MTASDQGVAGLYGLPFLELALEAGRNLVTLHGHFSSKSRNSESHRVRVIVIYRLGLCVQL
jgi:hypothetical protein